jgi:hypothetical protein
MAGVDGQPGGVHQTGHDQLSGRGGPCPCVSLLDGVSSNDAGR